MKVKVPEVDKCCFCLPLRPGIIIFAYINVLFSIFAVVCLVITTESKKQMLTNDKSLEVVTSTVLFSILGMGVILNILLLVAGFQKDIMMLRLYNYYALATILAALVPTFVLLSRMMLFDVCAALFAIVMQFYVIVVVRSEVMKLESKQTQSVEDRQQCVEEASVVEDRQVLI